MTNTNTDHTPINLHPGIVLMVPADLVNDPTTKTLVDRCKALIEGGSAPSTTTAPAEDEDLETMRKWNELGLKLFRDGGISLSVALEHAEAATAGLKFVSGETEERIAAFFTNTIKEIARRGVYLQSLGRAATDKEPDNSDAHAVNAAWMAIAEDPETVDGVGWFEPDSLMGRFGQSDAKHSASFWEDVVEIVKGADRYIRSRLMGLDFARDLEPILRLVDSIERGDLSILDENYAPFLNVETEEHDYKGEMDHAAVCLARKDYVGCVNEFFSAHGCAARLGELPLDYRIGLIAWLCYRGMEPVPATSEAQS